MYNMTEQIDLKWIGTASEDAPRTVTFGVPWPRGVTNAADSLTVCVASQAIPTQTWPLAYWPDGSIKWTGVATVLPAGAADISLQRQPSPAPENALECQATKDAITVTNGNTQYRINRQGDIIIDTLEVDRLEVARNGHLLASIRRRQASATGFTETVDEYRSRIDSADIVSAGPVRVTVKVTGKHVQPITGAECFPFTLYLYFYAGDPGMQISHFFIYDGNPKEDFLQSVGLRFEVPMRDQLHNRFVLFGGDTGHVWREPVRTLPPMLPGSGTANPERERQLNGEFVDAGIQPEPKPYSQLAGVAAMPSWGDFRLFQDSADHFTVYKACSPEFRDLPAVQGNRAAGFVVLADSQGGLAVGQREFWQTFPSELAVSKANTDVANVTAWFWSPSAPVSDMRHYTDKYYGALYENHYPFEWEAGPYAPQWVSAYGTGKSHFLTIVPLSPHTSQESIQHAMLDSSEPGGLVCTPEYYHQTGAFGVWGLIKHDTAKRTAVEDQLKAMLDYYIAEVDRRSWYGFWNYGDFMHSYDPQRHCWRYDEGGYGWSNEECMPSLWLWYSFLRSGREDVYKQASAMTRHIADVDVFHIGPYAGLASRHNVSHWGCSVKTRRISQAGSRRFYYFLTADEHIGDLLSEALESHPKGEEVTDLSPGWTSYCWDWVTAWERTQDTVWRDKILRGIDSLLAMNPPFPVGNLVTLNIDTGTMSPKDFYTYHMTLPFAGPEIWMELPEILENEEFAKAVANYGRFLKTGVGGETSVFAARLIGYAAKVESDPELAEAAWNVLLNFGWYWEETVQPVTGEPIRELLRRDRGMGHTNMASQWSLSTIECLELIPETLD